MRLYVTFTLWCLATMLFSQQVGINKTAPEYTLDVRHPNNNDAAVLNISNQDISKFVRFFSGNSFFPDPSMKLTPGQDFLLATYNDNALTFTELMRIASSGDVGIGMTNPQARLDILGGDWNLDAGNAGDLRIGNPSWNFRIGIATGGGGAGITRLYTNFNSMILGTANRHVLTLGRNANVGVGTLDPKGRLEVHSAGISDTLILLENSEFNVGRNYGIYMDDKNNRQTIGAYLKTDYKAIYAETIFGTDPTIEAVSSSTSGVNSVAVLGTQNSSNGKGIVGHVRKKFGVSEPFIGNGIGVSGISEADAGIGVRAESTGSKGRALYAKANGTGGLVNAILAESGGGNSFAAYFNGKVQVNGSFAKSSGSFKIDHPLDPENKYLYHSFVESPDMMNIYNGNVVTDDEGNAVVKLPEYFEALNIDYRYQLTVIGEFAQAIIGEKISNGKFMIKTDKPGIEVSWQVTGVRNDAYARKNRIQVEEEKEPYNRGKYLTPEAFGQPFESGINRQQSLGLESNDAVSELHH